MTLKQEIEKILCFRLDIRQSDFSLGNDKLAAEDLYKLFLSKQIELLTFYCARILSSDSIAYKHMEAQVIKLESELKALQ